MSSAVTLNEASIGHIAHHDDAHHGEHHHKETFISKYVFSLDHKTISKQFLVTGIIWAIVGGLFSAIGISEYYFSLVRRFIGALGKGWKIAT
jgi:cytochrome c oxidase subunit 1